MRDGHAAKSARSRHIAAYFDEAFQLTPHEAFYNMSSEAFGISRRSSVASLQ